MKTWLTLTGIYIVLWCLFLYTDFYDGRIMVIGRFALFFGTLFHISASVAMGTLHLGLLIDDLKYKYHDYQFNKRWRKS